MKSMNPYLLFDNNCEEAMNFYKDCLGGEFVRVQRFGDGPMEVPEEAKNLIMHISLKFEGGILMGSDSGNRQPVVAGNTVTINLDMSTVEEINSTFEKLSEGGTVTMPLQDQFWGARFGILTDKFGIHWMMNCQLEQQQ